MSEDIADKIMDAVLSGTGDPSLLAQIEELNKAGIEIDIPSDWPNPTYELHPVAPEDE